MKIVATMLSIILAMPMWLVLLIPFAANAATVDIDVVVPALCGNGVKEGSEACDAADIGTTCALQGFTGGDISCSGTCTLNTSLCTNDNDQGGAGAGAVAPPVVVIPPVVVDPPVDPVPDPVVDPIVDPIPDPVFVPDPVVVPDPQVDPPPAVDPVVDQPDDEPIQNDPADVDNGAPPVIVPVPAEPPVELPPADNVLGGLAPGDEQLVQGFAFWIGNRTFSVAPHNGKITSLAGDTVSIASRVNGDPRETIAAIRMAIGNTIIPFNKGNNGSWYTDLTMPAAGSYRTIIEITYKSGKITKQELLFVSAPYGRVTESGTGNPIEKAQVQLFDITNGGALWNGAKYNQPNPLTASAQGFYGYLVPNGTYKLVVEHSGYKKRETFTFDVRDHIVNNALKLIKEEPDLSEVVSIFTSDASIGEKFSASVNVISGATKEAFLQAGESISDAARKVNDIADNPQVEEVTKEVVAPTVATVAVATVVPSLWGIILPFLRYIFLQPLLLFGRRKRKEWGVVYNALTKLPIDLATIRLIDLNTGKIKQSRVTDTGGRYLFVVEPGKYKIEVMKQGYTFPTSVLRGIRADGEFIDIYHGEDITAEQEHIGLTPNIPVDPVGDHKTPRRIVLDKFLRGFQHTISLAGVVFAGVSLYISPILSTQIIFAVNVILYIAFLRFVKPPKPRGWGLVSEYGGAEIKNAVVRLFTKEYNKLVATQVTDSKGRYAFLVGPNDYYVKVTKPGYEEYKSDDIAVKGKKASSAVLKERIEVNKLGDTDKEE